MPAKYVSIFGIYALKVYLHFKWITILIIVYSLFWGTYMYVWNKVMCIILDLVWFWFGFIFGFGFYIILYLVLVFISFCIWFWFLYHFVFGFGFYNILYLVLVFISFGFWKNIYTAVCSKSYYDKLYIILYCWA